MPGKKNVLVGSGSGIKKNLRLVRAGLGYPASNAVNADKIDSVSSLDAFNEW